MDGTGARASGRLVAGRYRLTQMLGRGGMGVVWRATDELIGRPVAVKELHILQGLTDGEQSVVAERALREARAAGRVRHPGVVAIHDLVPAGAEDEAVYIVMELLEGPSLAGILEREGVLPEERVARIGEQVLDALDAAHSIGLVHRDVKPSNIIVLPGDVVKLVDFGIAHAVDDTRLTRHGVAGSTGYMAPELFEGKPPSPAVDLWAVGVTLLQAVEGRGPFERASTAATIHAILHDDPPALDGYPLLGPVVAGLLARDPASRVTTRRISDPLQSTTTITPSVVTPQGPTVSPAGDDAAVGRADWEDHTTAVRPAGAALRRPRAGTQTPAAPSFTVSTPETGLHVLARIALLILALWTVFRLANPMDGVSIQTSAIAILVMLTLFALADRQQWWGRVRISAEGFTVSQRKGKLSDRLRPAPREHTVPWEHVDEVLVARIAPLRTRAALRMASTAPSAITKNKLFSPFVFTKAGKPFTWTLGDVDASISTVEAAFEATKPSSVARVQSIGPNAGPARARLFAAVLLCGATLGGTYVFEPARPASLGEVSSSGPLVFSPDGSMLASVTDDNTITLWDVAARKQVAVLTGHTREIEALEFGPGGTALASASQDYTIKLWNTKTFTNSATFPSTRFSEASDLAFSPDGTRLASAHRRSVKLWDVGAKKEIFSFSEKEAEFVAVGFTRDGEAVRAADSGNTSIRYWDVASGRATEPRDGDTMFTANGFNVEVREVKSRRLLHTLTGHTGQITRAARGGADFIATSSADRTIRIWRVDTGQMVKKLEIKRGEGASADAIALSADGKVLAYSSIGKVRLWNTGIGS
ncbi:WD40 repeat domain-containing serine/threonine protein kinase [Streptomyces sp. URMC 123]|uniref:WD40 repeat domain-containing serine/threonine protein kinase n=1 Tax=Streptomyces sp. URMC 123 TaxID=3423403 RepID=UPI003F1B8035